MVDNQKYVLIFQCIPEEQPSLSKYLTRKIKKGSIIVSFFDKYPVEEEQAAA